MTINELAQQCLQHPDISEGESDWDYLEEMIVPKDLEERIVAALRAAVAEECEACAKLLDLMASRAAFAEGQAAFENGAAAIRARGEPVKPTARTPHG